MAPFVADLRKRYIMGGYVSVSWYSEGELKEVLIHPEHGDLILSTVRDLPKTLEVTHAQDGGA